MTDADQPPPFERFKDDIRPADVLLRVYSLLDCQDRFVSEGEMLDRVRGLLSTTGAEDLLVIHNEIFLGIVRERARLTKADLRTEALTYLLRQAIVVACTALDAYLPMLLRAHLPRLVAERGADFLPNDRRVREYFQDLRFDLADVLRLMNSNDGPLFISNKLLGVVKGKYLGNVHGVHIAGALLGLREPWPAIAAHLAREAKALTEALESAVGRRNDIVHRADRGADGHPTPLSPAQARIGVDTVRHVCEALHELVDRRPAGQAAFAARRP